MRTFIANTQELQDELRRILAYAQIDRPSRVKLSKDLNELAKRVVAKREILARGLNYDTKPEPGEEKYVDWDDDTDMYCVFGEDSGFAYASFADKQDANDWLRHHRR
jgi:hypothetical protein